jgi:16S rRNA (adenine1518-N6/adenine1519-N6)-dimethyltransferase
VLNNIRLYSPSELRRVIDKYEIRIKKSLGQNFLIDGNILSKIVTASEIKENETCVEIGPGMGVLTQALTQKAKRVVAIEIDRQFIPWLQELFAQQPNVQIILDDILKVDLNAILKSDEPVKLVANLPYYITTPILQRFFDEDIHLKSAVLMMQQEVAERLKALPGTKDYGALSCFIQYKAEIEYIARIPKTAFYPQPKVDSAVIRLMPREYHNRPEDEEILFALIKQVFSQRRKTLRKAMAPLMQQYGLSGEDVLKKAGIDDSLRGETLSLEAFISIANIIAEML